MRSFKYVFNCSASLVLALLFICPTQVDCAKLDQKFIYRQEKKVFRLRQENLARLYRKGVESYRSGKFHDAIHYLKEAESYQRDSYFICITGQAYLRLGQYEKAREYFLESLELLESKSYSENYSVTYIYVVGHYYLGQISIIGSNHKAAAKSFNQVRKYINKKNRPNIDNISDYPDAIHRILYSMALQLINFRQFDSAEPFISDCLYYLHELKAEAPDVKGFIKDCYVMLGFVFQDRKDYQQAHDCFIKARKFVDKSDLKALYELEKLIAGANKKIE